MSQKFFTVMTLLGLSKFASLSADKKPLVISSFSVGTGGGDSFAPTADELRAFTSLVDPVFSGPISRREYSEDKPNQYYIEGEVPVDSGPYVIREVGWFDVDGDLIYVTKYPPINKTTLSEGAYMSVPVGTYISYHQVDGGTVIIEVDSNMDFLKTMDFDVSMSAVFVSGSKNANLFHYRFMEPGILELPSNKNGRMVRVIVDHSVDFNSGDCVVRSADGNIATPNGSDSNVRIVRKGFEFVFVSSNGAWRVS